jgi:lysophospholipase L1-like esterase
MHHPTRSKYLSALLALLLTTPVLRAQATTGFQPNDLTAICGDSITFQKVYSTYLEDYMLMCQPVASVNAMQFGVGGETVPRFFQRTKDVLTFKPTVATIFYGMNDGSYQASNAARQATYRTALTDTVKLFKTSGVRWIVLASPGVVDTDSFKRIDANVYNKTLGDLAQIAKEVAADQQVTFADVHTVMGNAMTQAKAKYGEKYHVAGDDGIHPGANGHLAIAYTFLKAFGVSGDIGTITLDMRANTGTATDGHKILSVKNGVVQVESTRYPFCFFGDPSTQNSTRGMIEFIPFNQDLNRYTLVVKNASAANLKVTWGKQSKTFPASTLQKGINLAAEFLDNPFSDAFAKVDAAVRHQQDFEGSGLNSMLHSISDWASNYPEQRAAFDQFRTTTLSMVETNRKTARDLVQPVQHTLKVEAAN